MKSYTVKKQFTSGVKLPSGELKCFTTELTTTIEVGTGEQLVAESDKLFAQVKYLCEKDIEQVFPPVEEQTNG